MIIYVAGNTGCIRHMPHKDLHEHVLFSFFAHQRKTLAWMIARKEKELYGKKKPK